MRLPSCAGGGRLPRPARVCLFRVIDAKGEKAAIGDEQAKRTAILVSTPFRCAIDGPPLFDELSIAQGPDDFVQRGAFDGQALRKGKKRSFGALCRGTEDHELTIAELGLLVGFWT